MDDDTIVVDATTLTPEERAKKNLRPPWQPGQSGNPKGRPRKRPLSDRYEQLLETPLPREIAMKLSLPSGALWADAIAHVSARTALKGTETGILQRKEIREAIEGKATQRIEFQTDEEVNITVSFEDLLGHKRTPPIIDVQPEPEELPETGADHGEPEKK